MADRRHGYDVSVGYAANFLREIAPDWLRFCIRAQGFEPPQTRPDYRYLDLGCGPGFHLCLLAAANPQAEFVGIDFQSDHIAEGKQLAASAELTNVRFVQADFLDLAAAWPADLGAFDFIGIYGILSWVSDELRAAVFQCVAGASKPGTVAAFGYNTQPGWLKGVAFQHVANEFSKSRDPDTALKSAMKMFWRLTDTKAPISQLLAAFKPQLEVLATQPTSYLAHEFLTDNWAPLWHSSVARDLEDIDFTHVGSATVAEALLPDSLDPELRRFIAEQTDQALRQDVQDIVINQQFRRDIFCRGPVRATGADLDEDAPIFLFQPPPEGAPVRFKTTFGGLVVDYSAVADIVAALADGPKTVGELMALPSPVLRHTRSMLLSMLEANMLVIGAATPGSVEIAQRFNAAVARAVARGASYQNTAAAALGSGTPAGELDLLLLDAWLSDGARDEPSLAARLVDRLSSLGRELKFQGSALSAEQLRAQALSIAQLFTGQVVPRWRKLGVVE